MYPAFFRRELRIGARTPGAWAFGLIFFFLFLSLSALVLGPESARLRDAGAAAVWLGAAFAILLSAQSLFADWMEDGELDVFLSEPVSLSLIVAMRLAARFLLGVAPLILLAPLAALAFSLEEAMLPLTLSLLFGAPGALIYAACGAAAGASAKGRGGLVGPLIAGPLLAPVLIFGTLMTESGLIFGAEAKALLAFSLLAAAVGPLGCALALRAQAE